MKVAIIGYGVEGKSAAEYWHRLGDQITICDQGEDVSVPAYAEARLGSGYLRGLNEFDVIVRSAGINPAVITAGNPGVESKITTVVNEFLRVCPTKNVIGVTGTKGKGTTSSLITEMLKNTGRKVFLGGNIGLSPLDFLPYVTADSWVVLELSSFQLYDLKYSPHIGVCLMIAPEHLNWHAHMDDYLDAKSNMFRHQTPHDTAIYYAENSNSHRVASVSSGAKITFYAAPGAYVADGYIQIDNQQICAVEDLKLLGKFNWQNVCAAVTAVWQVTQDVTPLRRTLNTFSGLEHRLEFVREVHGVKYYDDSFGTAPQTAIVAIEAFSEPKILILGGSNKGIPFESLAKVVAHSNVPHVLTIGETAPLIETALKNEGYTAITPGGKTMPEIVKKAAALAKPGDVVLLSPACASFGMFENYKARGNEFKQAVLALA
ncbi:MAG TPA: UDP-N-acetylmuramoyl-L-alanine--D-glutamate ligase [Candidatus Saccharimonadales bacterium]|nr:UDP-N-acetylmuramoyl-L-alanine--D-glutamate ligase [Candidatus Saccharimonadales bacterium]